MDVDVARIRFVRLEHSATIDLAAIWRREASPLVDGFIDSARAAIDEAAAISR
jgi:hypothetical protein